MSRRSISSTVFFFAILVLIALLPLLGRSAGILDESGVRWLYRIEILIAGILIAFFYAKRLIVFGVVLGLLLWQMYIAGIVAEGREVKVILTFWGLYGLCWLAYIETSRSRYGEALRRMHPFRQLLAYTLFMIVSLLVCGFLTVAVYRGWDILPLLDPGFFAWFFTAAFLVPALSAALLRVIDIVGPRHFIRFFLGTYYSPVEQERIVMFMDMEGSTTMAEILEPKESLSLVARFVFDASAVIRAYGGDILNYTGDGLVVIWPLRQADRVIAAVQALRARFAARRADYIREFTIAPEFRIGLHAGKIVIGQIGEEKLFLSLYGDAVNTAARMEQMNKALGTSVLMTAAVVEQLSMRSVKNLDHFGPKPVPGRDEQVDVYALP